MKSLKNSFLFFLFINILLVCTMGFAQQSVDSLNYYSSRIDQIESDTDLKDAYQFFKNHLESNEKENHKVGEVYDLYFISKIDFKIGFYDDSETSAVKGLSILDKLNNDDYNIWLRKILYNHLGKIYKQKKIYSEAIKKYNQALALTSKPKDSLVIYNNISNILKDQKQFKEAEKLLLDAVKMFSRVNDTLEIARVINNLGFNKLKLNQEESLSYLSKALELRKQSKDSSDLYPSYKNLYEYYISQKDSSKAITYAIKAYNIANFVNSPSYKLDASRLRMNLGDYSVYNEFITLNDSLDNAAKLTRNKYALLKYDVSLSELKSQKERTNRQLYQFIAALILISGISLIFVLKSKHKKEKLQQVYNTETRISKKVHDEVANDVYQVMTKLQSDKTINNGILDDMESIYDRTRDISNENSTIDFNEKFENTLTDLVLSYNSDRVNIITKDISKIQWHTISNIKKTIIYRVLQELMVNMKKHSEASIVVITFGIHKGKTIIDYKDNGIGNTVKTGNGLRNAENRIQSINGTLTFESENNKGFTAKITV